MPLIFDPSNAMCQVFTCKEGMLSTMGHDLELRATKFRIEVEGGSTVRATFDATSLRVFAAIRQGAADESVLSPSDKSLIESHVGRDVLEAKRFSEIAFVSNDVSGEGDSYRIVGDLSLHGVTRRVDFRTRKEKNSHVAELELLQSDYRIKPFSAFLGTLKIKDKVRVRVTLPA